MKLYITCTNGIGGTARYGQEMVADIAHQLGFRDISIYCYDSSGESEASLSSRYDGIIAGISQGDIVFFQHPTWNLIRFDKGLIRRMKVYGARIIIVLHDLIPLMFEGNWDMLEEEIEILNLAELLVVPSYAMKHFLMKQGIHADMKFVIQEIWDYTTDISFPNPPAFQKKIHFAGKPSKFVFPNEWDSEIPLQVYARDKCSGKNVLEMGYLDSASLLLELSKGGLGLAWYGNEYWHQYMRYNCSFKISTYLAAGIPIIVPRGISNQHLIEENHLGIVVDSLDEAIGRVENMDEAEYQEYVRSVDAFAPLIRGGYFAKKFLIEAIHKLMRQNMDAD